MRSAFHEAPARGDRPRARPGLVHHAPEPGMGVDEAAAPGRDDEMRLDRAGMDEQHVAGASRVRSTAAKPLRAAKPSSGATESARSAIADRDDGSPPDRGERGGDQPDAIEPVAGSRPCKRNGAPTSARAARRTALPALVVMSRRAGVAGQQVVAGQERLALEVDRVGEAGRAGFKRVIAAFADDRAGAGGRSAAGGRSRISQAPSASSTAHVEPGVAPVDPAQPPEGESARPRPARRTHRVSRPDRAQPAAVRA